MRRGLIAASVAVVVLLLWWQGERQPAITAPLPARLTDREFWTLVVDASEADQPFRSNGAIRTDNLISNERGFQAVIPVLTRISRPGAYLGVGPEQNFSYIAAIQPTIAFIVDIRRDNLRLHLLYKALIEMSNDRAEFLSLLFGRTRPASISPAVTAKDLFAAYRSAPRSDALAKTTLTSVLSRLEQAHGFTLSADDEKGVRNAYSAFSHDGGGLKWDVTGAAWIPSYADLMSETDGRGVNRSYLASEANFQALKKCEAENRLVPLVGDFGGRRALQAVGRYLRDHDTPVSAFYMSNVEQYLFGGGNWQQFYSNVSALPVDAQSLVIRTIFNTIGFARTGPEYQTITLLEPMRALVDDFAKGRIAIYNDVVRQSTPAR